MKMPGGMALAGTNPTEGGARVPHRQTGALDPVRLPTPLPTARAGIAGGPGNAGKASAIAYPIQGLVKYHGLRDPVRRIPYHPSISLCSGPIHSHTTVAVLAHGPASAAIDGIPASGRALERVQVVVGAIQEKVGDDRPLRIVSRNDFPQYVGLGSSSSGFAALAVATAAALGWDADATQLSEVARLGAGSASRAVTGGISEWVLEGERSYSKMLAPPEDLGSWRIVVPLVRHDEPTETVHAEVTSSPLFAARNAYVPGALDAMRAAVASRDVRQIAPIAERDTLSLHAVTMTSDAGRIPWMPATVEVMHRVRALRARGVPAWFSIDTGATAYVNTDAEHEDEVAAALAGVPGVAELLRLRPAGPARLVDEHLF